MNRTTELAYAQQAFDKLLAAYKAEQHNLIVEASSEDEIEAATDRLAIIQGKIWESAAPDLRAVLVKMEIANHETEMPSPKATASIIADLRRLSGQSVSPIFQADLWLTQWEERGGSYLVRHGEAIICGDPTNPRHRKLTRALEQANGSEAVKAMVIQCCKGLVEEVEA
ncbi:MAG: hypothetical protein IT552_09710 [Sphingomonadaceae bacterium]|nr:hypothetical protein [Sphingomonadaceae bacterium]